MSRVIEDAIRRINEEMQKAPSDRMLEAVGQHLIDACRSDAAAKALLNEKKTLAGAVGAMREAARKKQSGGCYAMAAEEAWEIVRGYYGLPTDPDRPMQDAAAEKQENPKSAEAIELDFDSFWG